MQRLRYDTTGQKYIRDLTIRGKAENTQQVYTACVADLRYYYNRSPDLLTYDQVADWLFHLRDERKLAFLVNIAVSAARFLYRTTLGRDTAELLAKVPRLKRETKRAHAYSVEEVEAILKAARRPRDIAFLRMVYGYGTAKGSSRLEVSRSTPVPSGVSVLLKKSVDLRVSLAEPSIGITRVP